MLSGMARWGVWAGGEKIIPDGCRFASHGETYWVEPRTNLLQKNKNVRITESQWVVMSVTFKTKKQTSSEQRVTLITMLSNYTAADIVTARVGN